MATSQFTGVIRHLRRATLLQDGGGMTDGQLLECFLTRRDEAAFEVLLRRHGPMVLGVCRRVLRNIHDAEDAFQATFLIFVRKATAIRQRESVACWLHRAAFRAALEANAVRRRSRARQVNAMPEPEAAVVEDIWSELRPLLDQELDRLPDKYREAVVLCDLKGKTRKEAAQQLGIPEGTLSGRLTTARRLLAGRLTRHGLTISGGALAVILSQRAALAGVPNSVVVSTIKAASLFAAGQSAATGVISVKVAVLTEGVLKTMFLTRLKKVIALIAFLGLVALGGGLLTQHVAIAQPGPFERTAEAFQKDDTTQTDLQNLQGTWTLVEAHQHGKKVDAKDLPAKDLAWKSHQLTVAGEKIAIRDKDGGGDAHGKFKLDTAKQPKEIRITWFIIAWFCIYKVDGDTLTICMNENTNLPLPDEFRTQADSDRLLFVYQRTKSDQDKGQGVDQRPDLSGTQPPVVPEINKVAGSKPVVVQEDAQVRGLAWGSNGKILATVGIVYETVEFTDGDGKPTDSGGVIPHSTIKLWDATTGKLKRSLGEEKDTFIAAIAFSADGKTAAISTSKHVLTNQPKNPIRYETEARVMDAQTWALKHKVKTGGFASALTFSPDGTRLALGGRDGLNDNAAFVRLWDVQKQKMIGETESGGYRVHCLAFSIDGKQLASGDENGKVRLFDGRTGAVRRDFEGHGPLRSGGEQCVTGVGFSPEGKTLVSGSQNKTLKLWDVETGKLLRNLEGNKARVSALAFSPDGKLFATAGSTADSRGPFEVLLWDMNTGQSKKTFPEQTVPVNSLAFSPDGSTLAIGAGAGFNSAVNTETGRAKTPGEFKLWKIEIKDAEKDGERGIQDEKPAATGPVDKKTANRRQRCAYSRATAARSICRLLSQRRNPHRLVGTITTSAAEGA